jgi:hypothetical protein
MAEQLLAEEPRGDGAGPQPVALAEVSAPPAQEDANRTPRRLARATWFAMALGAVPRIWAAIWDQSILWPDEVHQTMEQAHRLAFGYGMIPWEFRSGARSWVFPGLMGLWWMLVSHLGVHRSFGLVVSAKLLMAAVSLLAIELGRRVATRLGGPTAGLVAVILLGACPLILYFASRVMTETASGAMVLAAVYLSLLAEKPRPALAGAIASLAIYLRYQNGLVAVGLLAILIWRGEGKLATRYAIAATVVGLLGGMLDWVTWSYPFESFWVYLKFNLIDGRAAEVFGASSIGYYFGLLESSVGSMLGLLVVGLAVAWRRSPELVTLVAVFFGVHCFIPHKELRFLLPVVPLAVALAGVGLTDLFEAASGSWRLPVGITLAMAVAMGAKAATPRLRDVGRPGDQNIWHIGEDYFRAMWKVASRPDLCGISLVDNDREWTGGYTYLHRNVPMYFDLDHLKETNYVVGGHEEKLPEGWQHLGNIGQYGVYKRAGTCSPVGSDYKTWLN